MKTPARISIGGAILYLVGAVSIAAVAIVGAFIGAGADGDVSDPFEWVLGAVILNPVLLYLWTWGFFRVISPRSHPDVPTIVCLVGSTRFYPRFQQANFDETMKGKIVLSVGFYPHAAADNGREFVEKVHGQDVGVTPEEKERLDRLHLRKIDLADEVLVLNVRGYIGESTEREILYAWARGKRIAFIEPPPPWFKPKGGRVIRERGVRGENVSGLDDVAGAPRPAKGAASGVLRPDRYVCCPEHGCGRTVPLAETFFGHHGVANAGACPHMVCRACFDREIAAGALPSSPA